MTREKKATEPLAVRAYALFDSFRNAYAPEWQRLDKCERLYRGEHWQDVPMDDPNEPRPMTPVIHSTVENVAADLADDLPCAVITPENNVNARIAKIVEAVIARNHDAASYDVEYQKLIHDLLVAGCCVQEVGYDSAENGGLGGAFIRHTDVRCIMFDPLACDIQDGRAVFKFSLRSKEWIEQHFPDKAGELDDDLIACSYLPEDGTIKPDRKDAMLLIEYWRREYDSESDSFSVHMALLCGGVVLRDSQSVKPEGYFAHGQYPFIVTTLYPRKGSALGFGLCDLFEGQQRYADKLDQIVLKNALMASRNKLLVTEASGFDADDLADWSREVHRGESLSGVSWFSTPPLPAYITDYIARLHENVKEEGGANDSSRGSANNNVTAASAIYALQEASTKRTRMSSQRLHEAFRKAVRMEIEVEREFNFYLRPVVVTEDGTEREELFNSADMTACTDGMSLPIEFYVSIKAAKKSRFKASAQNEIAMQLLSMGAIQAEQAVELMVFDGKQQVLSQIAERKKQGGIDGINRNNLNSHGSGDSGKSLL